MVLKMSQASNKVKWCLKKAKKELEESDMHRGLVKTDSNIELAKKHIIKAEHNLKAALYFEMKCHKFSVIVYSLSLLSNKLQLILII